MEYRDLETVRALIKDATDLDITYAYDDLVFPDNTAFIFKYNDKEANNFFCYFHEDCVGEEQKKLITALKDSAKKRNCSVNYKGSFSLKQKNREVDIIFNP